VHELLFSLAASSNHSDVTVCPSVHLSVLYFFLTIKPLMEHVTHIRRDSRGGSTRRGQCTFSFEYYMKNILVHCSYVVNAVANSVETYRDKQLRRKPIFARTTALLPWGKYDVSCF